MFLTVFTQIETGDHAIRFKFIPKDKVNNLEKNRIHN